MDSVDPRRTATAAKSAETRRLVVEDGAADRLDRYLARRLGFSRSRCADLILAQRVRVDSDLAKKSVSVSEGQVIEVEIPPPEPLDAEPEDIPLDVVFEDEAFLVLNKAAGLVVHPAPGHRSGTLVNALLHHVQDLSGIGGKLRPGIVHRLDRYTSGLMLVAKGDDAHVALSDSIRKREVRRIYRAVSWGHLPETPVTVDAPVGRDPKDRMKMAVVEGGRRAVTRLRVRESWEAAEYLEKAARGLPQRARIHYNLGLLLQLLGRDSEAEKELLAALRIEPDNIDFLYAAADHYLKRGRLGEAKRMAETMIEKHPSNRLGQDLLGFINNRIQE